MPDPRMFDFIEAALNTGKTVSEQVSAAIGLPPAGEKRTPPIRPADSEQPPAFWPEDKWLDRHSRELGE